MAVGSSRVVAALWLQLWAFPILGQWVVLPVFTALMRYAFPVRILTVRGDKGFLCITEMFRPVLPDSLFYNYVHLKTIFALTTCRRTSL